MVGPRLIMPLSLQSGGEWNGRPGMSSWDDWLITWIDVIYLWARKQINIFPKWLNYSFNTSCTETAATVQAIITSQHDKLLCLFSHQGSLLFRLFGQSLSSCCINWLWRGSCGSGGTAGCRLIGRFDPPAFLSKCPRARYWTRNYAICVLMCMNVNFSFWWAVGTLASDISVQEQ